MKYPFLLLAACVLSAFTFIPTTPGYRIDGIVTGLPDNTWLSSLSLQQKRLMIEGHSAAATRLIAALASEPRLRNPSFAAAVLRAENGEEIFTIQAEVSP